MKKKKINFKQWLNYGGKLAYNRGGEVTSPVLANTNATSEYVEPERYVYDENAKTQRTIGSVISGIGGVAAAANPIIGAVIGAIGGIVSGTAQPQVVEKQKQNTNPYGYKLGGKIPDPIKGQKSFTFTPGGIESQDTWTDKETALENWNNREHDIQQRKKILEFNLKAEDINPEDVTKSTPINYSYNPGMKFESIFDQYRQINAEQKIHNNRKPGLANGGDLEALSNNAIKVEADDPSLTDSVETDKVMLDHNEVVTGTRVYSDSLVNPNTGRTFAKDEEKIQRILGKIQGKLEQSGDKEFKDEQYLNENSKALFQEQEKIATMMGLRNQDGTPIQQSGMRFGGMIGKKKLGYDLGGPWNPFLGLNVANLANTKGLDSQGNLDESQFEIVPHNQNYELYKDNNTNQILDFQIMPESGDTTKKGAGATLADMLGGATPGDSTTSTGKRKDFPFGEVGTGVGLVSNFINKLTNKPTFVDYKDIGNPEIQMQQKALEGIRRGESTALGDATMEGRIARENLENRSLQSRNANLRNIAVGISKAKAGIRDNFANRMGNALAQFGQRRSAIEEANRQKNMQVDVINTQESDAVRTEAMKMDENVRKLMIEYQLSQNNRKTNEQLASLLKTSDFKFDPNTAEGIEFIKIANRIKRGGE